MSTSDPANDRRYELDAAAAGLRTARLGTARLWTVSLRTAAVWTTLFVVAESARPQLVRAQTVTGAPAGGANPSSSSTGMSPETMDRLQRQLQDSAPDPRFQPETGESISRKLQTGEYHFDVHPTPWYYRFGRIVFLIVTVVMFIATLVVRLTAKNRPQVGPAQDDLRRADALAETARGKYRNLFQQADRKNFAERREALAAEGGATETLFRQAAEHYRAASEKGAQAADPENPAAHEQARLLARAYAEQATAQTALADIAALLRDPNVTTVEEFRRRAEPPAAVAKAAAENCRQLMKQAGQGKRP